MAKIQGQSGTSLADMYDTVGSEAPINTLLSEEVNLVHEMGGTIQSERVGGLLRRRSTGALLQTVSFTDTITNISEFPSRLHSVTVYVDAAARMLKIVVSIHDVDAEREIPIFAWESANGIEVPIRVVDNGDPISDQFLLVSQMPIGAPTMLYGSTSPRPLNDIVIRGTTETFGAGDVTAIILLQISFTGVGGIDSRGLPIPSW